MKKSKQEPLLEEKVTHKDKQSSPLSKLRRRKMERDALHSKREDALRNKFK